MCLCCLNNCCGLFAWVLFVLIQMEIIPSSNELKYFVVVKLKIKVYMN